MSLTTIVARLLVRCFAHFIVRLIVMFLWFEMQECQRIYQRPFDRSAFPIKINIFALESVLRVVVLAGLWNFTCM